MKLDLKSTGGFAGLELAGRLDTADLPEDLARRVEELLTPDNLRAAAASRSLPMPDARQYHLTLVPEHPDAEARTHVIDDMSSSGEVLDVIDELIAELVRRKQEAVDGG